VRCFELAERAPLPEPGTHRLAHPLEIAGPLRLTIVRTIARGGMGQVYQAIQHGVEGFEKTVALKTILEPYSGDEEFVRMFIGEAKLVADLVHQNIVQVYHLGRDAGVLYIVMEYVAGMNLREILARHADTGRRMPVELAAFVASRVCRGLEYAHMQTDAEGVPLHVVHRDISPRNLLVSRLGEVKIGDFGIAKARSLTIDDDDRRLRGKYAYMSPEHARCEATDNRSDLYSLGLVLWEMLVGERPRPGDIRSREAWLAHVRSTPVPPVASRAPGVPPMLAKIVDRAVSMDPDQRYADAGEMGYDLEYFMYHKGYGPTIVTLAAYLSKAFPSVGGASPVASEADLEPVADTTVSGLRPRPWRSDDRPDRG
jgi:serine/threonine-protein kinase